MRGRFSIVLVLVFAFAVTGLTTRAESTNQRTIDTAKSSAQFSIQHIFVDRVTGTVPIVSGSVTLTPGTSVPSSVSAVLDPTRLATDEHDRDVSLEGPDYFDVEHFPTWTFSSSKINSTGTDSFEMDGLLMLHGVTQTEHLEVTVRGDSAHPVYHAIGHIDRHDFGMKGARLDPVIGKDAEVTLVVVVK